MGYLRGNVIAITVFPAPNKRFNFYDKPKTDRWGGGIVHVAGRISIIYIAPRPMLETRIEVHDRETCYAQ